MTEQEFNAAQAADQVTKAELPEAEKPATNEPVDAIKTLVDTYLKNLEALRKGLVGCKFYLSSNQTVTGHAMPYDVVHLDTLEYAEHIDSDATAHTIRIPNPGFYLVVFQAEFDGAVGGDSLAVEIRANGTLIELAEKKAAGNTDFISSVFTAEFNGAELISMGASSPGRTVLGTAFQTFLSITKL